jgi:hypothetical protein
MTMISRVEDEHQNHPGWPFKARGFAVMDEVGAKRSKTFP